jgi:hypothetical protein
LILAAGLLLAGPDVDVGSLHEIVTMLSRDTGSRMVSPGGFTPPNASGGIESVVMDRLPQVQGAPVDRLILLHWARQSRCHPL